MSQLCNTILNCRQVRSSIRYGNNHSAHTFHKDRWDAPDPDHAETVQKTHSICWKCSSELGWGVKVHASLSTLLRLFYKYTLGFPGCSQVLYRCAAFHAGLDTVQGVPDRSSFVGSRCLTWALALYAPAAPQRIYPSVQKLRCIQLCPAITVGDWKTGNNYGDSKVINAAANAFGKISEELDKQSPLVRFAVKCDPGAFRQMGWRGLALDCTGK